MKYWQFVNWEPAPIESALKSRVAVAIAAYESGDKNAIKEYYRQSATIETLQNPVVKLAGGRFPCVSFAGCIGYSPAIMALWSYTRRISPLFMPYWGGIMF